MTKQIKAFATSDSHTDNTPGVVRSLYELSPMGQTYAKNKKQYHSTEDSLYGLHVFKEIDLNQLTQSEVNSILRVVARFVQRASLNPLLTKTQLILSFIVSYNLEFPTEPVGNLAVGALLESSGLRGPDFLSFEVRGIQCSVWVSDASFRGFYNDYEIDLIYPFPNFQDVVLSPAQMLQALSTFSFVLFNDRIEARKNNIPTTYTKILNIPYHLPNSTVVKDCYFAFNQYGAQGNYDYVLKLYLYQQLLALGLTPIQIESLFPSILQINEFFIVPRWESVAIPSRIGQNGIRSQVSKAHSDVFDGGKYIKVYTDLNYLRDNTYNVPSDYNNILLRISNGMYTELAVRDFALQFSDLITVTSTHPDFARMSTQTQHFVTLLENLLFVADSSSQTEMLFKIVDNENYRFQMVSRQGIWYLSFFFGAHQYYVIPRYEYVVASLAP